jgi:hypothetical protein
VLCIACEIRVRTGRGVVRASLLTFCDSHVPPSFTSLETHIKAVKAEDMAVALAGAPMAKSRAAVEEDGDSKKRKARSKASRGVEILKKVDVSKMVKSVIIFPEKITQTWATWVDCFPDY